MGLHIVRGIAFINVFAMTFTFTGIPQFSCYAAGNEQSMITETVSDSFESTSTTANDEKLQRSLSYWSPSREAAAIPLDTNSTDSDISNHVAKREANSAKSSLAASTNNGSDAAVGKFFFVQNGKPYQCTASLVDSNNHLIATAAHCLHGGKGQGWSQNGVFVPGYVYGKDNVGYPVRTQRVFEDWISSGNDKACSAKNDIGFATVTDFAMPTVSLSRFGSYHVGHSGLTAFNAHIAGFPLNPGDNKVKYSYNAKTRFTLGCTDTIQVSTAFRDSRGSSGSPWIQSETITGNTGWMNGVTSKTDGKHDFSARFTERVYSLYTTALSDK